MTTMVVVASKHGSTAEIGEHIAATLKSRGVSAHVKEVSEASKWLYETDNVVLGIPVYRQKLWGPAMMFLDANRTELGGKPLFLFASGGGPSLAPELAETLRSYPHREATYFRGAIDAEKLSFFEKLQLKVAKAPENADYRDWPGIEDWSQSLIAYGLS
ncbi:flavodoxin domain-containing protein [Nesterenkonia sp. CF4.4]|uniref:flavodoxin domain-containing protein n=1 Tax=Nesterenkonia sp. CF4.4 TaxID=3373079 RepID=UPI003EE582DB